MVIPELFKLKKIYLLPSWCLGTLVRVPDEEKKAPRLAPTCLIGCAAYMTSFEKFYTVRHDCRTP